MNTDTHTQIWKSHPSVSTVQKWPRFQKPSQSHPSFDPLLEKVCRFGARNGHYGQSISSQTKCSDQTQTKHSDQTLRPNAQTKQSDQTFKTKHSDHSDQMLRPNSQTKYSRPNIQTTQTKCSDQTLKGGEGNSLCGVIYRKASTAPLWISV